ncbi:MAG: peptidylprolyl isomerase [Chitinophagaceae bacterium]|nr:peptidylprolyl isomerase [Chitinophagaceae bacterium]
MKKLIIIGCFLLGGKALSAQTLFTYGKHAVSQEEFLHAFYKNSPGEHSQQAMRDYLDLYISFKLKVQAAKDRRLDTSANQRAELLNFRRQIEESYLSDDSAVQALCREAFNRSLRDIRVSHIFIPFHPDYVNGPDTFFSLEPGDTVNAYTNITRAYNELLDGADFGSVAQKYSLDPSVKNNKGDIGYITVFTLPYSLENIAYQLNKGKFSPPYKSNAGYHILMKTDERPAFGRMKAAQILLSYAPGITAGEKQVLKARADSIYRALQQRTSFEALAKQFNTGRNVTSAGGALNPDFSIGKYDLLFESAVVKLENDGDYTLPFETGYGIHIVKRLAHIPPVADTNEALVLFKNNVLQDTRMELAKEKQDQKILEQLQYRFVFKSKDLLWRVTDSLLTNGNYIPAEHAAPETIVFIIGKDHKKLEDWWVYVQSIKSNYRQGSKLPYEKILRQYVTATARIYYQDHLEDYNADFRNQLTEFSEGNQLFEIMEKQVWNKGAEDQAGLKKQYENNKASYTWGPSVNAIFFTVMDKSIAEEIKKMPETYLKGWRTASEASAGKIIADSARFEINQLPGYEANTPVGQLAEMANDTGDGSVNLIYVLGKHNDASQKSFEEAKGLVINDYQHLLEQNWVKTLKKKYPVKIKEDVLKKILPPG